MRFSSDSSAAADTAVWRSPPVMPGTFASTTSRVGDIRLSAARAPA